MDLEKKQLEVFKNLWFNGKFRNQRYGQAFYNHFKLHKLSNQDSLQNLYEKDGEEAKKLIGKLFRFV